MRKHLDSLYHAFIKYRYGRERRKVINEMKEFTTTYGVMNNSKKYYMKFDTQARKIVIASTNDYLGHLAYFSSYARCQAAIEQIGSDRLMFYYFI